jgi:aminopeptidase-like protein
MHAARLERRLDLEAIGAAMHALVAELYPICRSITGDGVRETLARIGRRVPLAVHEVPSGTPAFDWTVPREWNIRDAWIKTSRGETVVDFKRSNLHVVSYSVPVRARMPLAALRPHLFSLPERPDAIPYRTSYYREDWGFCLSHERLEAMVDDDYDVCIDSSLEPGSLSYGELYIPGETDDEFLISCHICHPSLCNDNLSGIALAVALAEALRGGPRRRLSYRLLFIPGTIGSIVWLARNRERAARVKSGLVLACVGDAGSPTYKKSRRGDAPIDRAMAYVLARAGRAEQAVMEFAPTGYDERQFCSPGFDLPVGCFMRTPHGRFLEYHTSADDLAFVRPAALADSLARCLEAIGIVDAARTYVNRNPTCEPQLGRRGLYRHLGGPDAALAEVAMLWVLNLSDGSHDLLAIAERAGVRFEAIAEAAERLSAHGLVAEKCDGQGRGSEPAQ